MKLQEYMHKFLSIFVKLIIISGIFYFILSEFKLLNYEYYHYLISFIVVYIIFSRDEIKKDIHYYSLVRSVDKRFGKLTDRDYDCIYKVLNIPNRKRKKFKEWIDGHEFLYSEKEISIMKMCWNFEDYI